MRSLLFLFLIFPNCLIASSQGIALPPDKIAALYHECRLDSMLSDKVFRLAIAGFDKIEGLRNRKIITIIDYSKPSVTERLFVIDLASKSVLYRSLVAHGKNSGENEALSFSNDDGSLKSCLGFFITSSTYKGKNGYSLRLDGIEKGINDNARQRAIVIHGAAYVSNSYISLYGRPGRSWGCPVLPLSVSKEIIDTISDGSCLFIYGDDPSYLKTSAIVSYEDIK